MPEVEESSETLPILVSPDPLIEEDAKGLFGRIQREPPIVKGIPVQQLQEQLKQLTASVDKLMESEPATKSEGVRLKELSVQVEITASGGVHLIGTATVGATASMTLTFAR